MVTLNAHPIASGTATGLTRLVDSLVLWPIDGHHVKSDRCSASASHIREPYRHGLHAMPNNPTTSGIQAAFVTACFMLPMQIYSRRFRTRHGRKCIATAVGASTIQAPSSSDHAQGFALVPYGEKWEQRTPAICCDGLVAGADLQLTHWKGNATPSSNYADTSTEIALNFVAQVSSASSSTDDLELNEHLSILSNSTVVNNHCDSDGLIACWTLLYPQEALARKDALVAAACVGDFQEWPVQNAEVGLKLNAAIEAIAETCSSDEEAYFTIFEKMTDLVDDICDTGDRTSNLWHAAWQQLQDGKALIKSGTVHYWLDKHGVAVFEHPADIPELPGPIYNLASQEDLAAGRVRRNLLVFTHKGLDGDTERHFIYERPRHAWVQRLVTRVPVTAPTSQCCKQLLESLPEANRWVQYKSLAGIVRTEHPLSEETSIEKVLQALYEVDSI